MSLLPGTKLGPYEIVSPLGAGGMGEVYRARDTRLERLVAIKILPSHLSSNPDAKQRFERESRTISSLSHPNICHLYDVGSQDGIDYLVMQYLEGDTLADRLAKGPLPPEQVLKYGVDICEGLEKAHKSGVIHRDLKPGNIMLTKSGAMLMDFGLAKTTSAAGAPPSSSLTATMSGGSAKSPLTAEGTVVGTFHYMSPEQIEGKEADARSDIFALGAVLYEMATGKRAFTGKSQAGIAAAILASEPQPISAIQPMSPPALDRVVKSCLAKDPDERWQTAHDIKLELRHLAEGGSQAGVPAPVVSRRKNRERLAWALAALAIVAVAVLAAAYFAGQKPTRVLRAQLMPPGKSLFNFVGDNAGPVAISPDGRYVVFSALTDAKSQLFLRALDSTNAQPLPGTEDATFPFWSPDNRSIAFFQNGKLKRIEIAGGPPVTVCDITTEGRGGSWGSDGTIIFAPRFSSGIYQVSAKGGEPTPVTQLTDPKYTTHRWPWFLPDGRHFLYLAASHSAPSSEDTAVFFASLDRKENRRLVHTLSNAIYASGHLLFLRENALMAQVFDPSSGTLTGDAVALSDDVMYDASVWRATMAVSAEGTLIYRPGVATEGRQLIQYDRNGKELGKIGGKDTYFQVQLSPDEKKLALNVGDQASGIWTYDIARDVKTRLTFTVGNYSDFAWSPDGSQIAYTYAQGSGHYRMFIKSSNGAGEEKPLLDTDDVDRAVGDFSPDGRYLIYQEGTQGVGNRLDLWILPLFGDRKPFPYLKTPAGELDAQFSPDGRWIAYSSNASGRSEIYVAPFPWTGAKWQVSTNGGDLPRWRHDGKELFFVPTGDNQFMTAEVNGSGFSFEVGAVRPLFRVGVNGFGWLYAVSHDGQRFVVVTAGEDSSSPLTLVENWTAELKKK
jgi:serine/threonine protein kinase